MTIMPDNKKNYIPFKFGGYCLFDNDHNYDLFKYGNCEFDEWFKSNLSASLPDNPKSIKGILSSFYNPRFIHPYFGKWSHGQGLSILSLENSFKLEKIFTLSI